MSQLDGIKWFKQQLGPGVSQAVQGTPFSLDMAAAIAMQETYADCWSLVYQTLPLADVLKICVGDTLDYPNRTAFPKNKADLCQVAGGQQMFAVARQALLDIAHYNNSYKLAATNPEKFCHGYGIFQYDIQFYKFDQNFFLQQGWYDAGECTTRLLKELNAALQRAYGAQKMSLTDEEMMYVAVAYNAGRVRVGAGPQQGYRDSDGNYYGENFQKFLAMAHTVPQPPVMASLTAIASGIGTVADRRKMASGRPRKPKFTKRRSLPKQMVRSKKTRPSKKSTRENVRPLRSRRARPSK